MICSTIKACPYVQILNYFPMIDAHSSIKKLKSIRQGTSKYGNAPHKLILILTIIELIENGHFSKNEFCIDIDFVAYFRENWTLLVNTSHSPDFTQPFYYLQNEKLEGESLWELHPNLGFAITSHIRSINVLKEVISYASFQEDFYNLLQQPEFRIIARNTILDTYFANTKEQFIIAKYSGQGYINDLEHYLLNEKEAPAYKIGINSIDEEEIFVRSGLFPRLIRKVYSSTCCMSGMKIITDYGSDLIEAAHIIPFSLSRDDKVTNGLALCPNLHTAFDRGLVSIDDDLRVLVSPVISENTEHPYSLAQLNRKKIIMPFGTKHYPNIDNIRWHRDNIFKG